ncbi:MAG: hypothetical protein ACLPTQ_01215, partial [Terriglobales bacterium]
HCCQGRFRRLHRNGGGYPEKCSWKKNKILGRQRLLSTLTGMRRFTKGTLAEIERYLLCRRLAIFPIAEAN